MFGWRVALWGAVAMLLVGCFRRAALDDSPSEGAPSSSSGGTSSTSSGGTTDDGSTSSSTSSGGTSTTTGGTTGSTTSTSSDTGGAFIEEPDGGGSSFPCDITSQDCPAGEKCVPWCDDGGGYMFDATKCEPIPENPKAPWEPCVSEGGLCTGVDDCGIGSVCWGDDYEGGTGVCHTLCLDEGACPHPDEYCPIYAGWSVLCVPKCDPLLQDCEDGQSCQLHRDGFTCLPYDAAAGGDGAECEYESECLPGLTCVPASWLFDCVGTSCCTLLCDALLPEVCPNFVTGEVCVASFPKFGFDYVGVCRLP